MRFLLYLLVFVALAAVIVGYAAWSYVYAEKNESFEDGGDSSAAGPPPLSKPPGEGSSGASSTYDSRLYVLQTFDSVLRRKPTDAELDKYSRLGTNAAIMSAIVRDYGSLGGDTGGTGGAKKNAKNADDEDDCSSSSSSSDEDDDEDHSNRRGRRRRGADTDADVLPYSPDRVHRAIEASPDLGWKDESKRYSVARPYSTDGAHADVHADAGGDSDADADADADVPAVRARADVGAGADAVRKRKPAAAAAADGGKASPRKAVRGAVAGTTEDDARVCIERSDLLARLQGISDQVEQFKRFLDAV